MNAISSVNAWLTGRVESIGFAIYGICHMVRTQKNAQFHAVATVVVVIGGCAMKLAAGEWCWIIAAVGGVWAAEALNTAVELVCDVACPEFHPLIGHAKDVAAGGVLLTACAAIGIASCIFIPHVYR